MHNQARVSQQEASKAIDLVYNLIVSPDLLIDSSD
jgi:NurA-like 5'-3' nuclease